MADSSVLAFDYGLKRIGVASGQSVTGTASPLCTLRARDGQPDWNRLSQLLAEWQPDCLVVGVPLNMDGSESEMSRRARRFAGRLHGRFGLKVHLVDERLSSASSRQDLRDDREPVSARSPGLDELAAVVICEDWFRQQ